ncbi:MAG: hypothetical protein U1F43_36530 [Myxococcota bacterium]
MTSMTEPTARADAALQTPMMQQYLDAKAECPDALLLMRMGDFYELFMDDAVEAAAILELTLTARNKKDDNPIPMAGVPYHALQAYLPRLLAAGKKVAICEQVEDPKLAKGLVRRALVRVITPGVVLEEAALDGREPNWLAAIVADPAADGATHLALLDVSTGEQRGEASRAKPTRWPRSSAWARRRSWSSAVRTRCWPPSPRPCRPSRGRRARPSPTPRRPPTRWPPRPPWSSPTRARCTGAASWRCSRWWCSSPASTSSCRRPPS